MKTGRYQEFSRRAHEARGLSVAQFELTFGCDLRCRHCMTDCYNKPVLLQRELPTREVKEILDRLKASGVLWLCLTGGDPLTRGDFPEIHEHAKKLGFIVTVFTNGCRIDRGMARLLGRMQPFVIEITLNAITEELYERISGRRGSFGKVMAALELLKAEHIPIKLKTQVTRENAGEAPRIQAFARGRGIPWDASCLLYPRLNGDLGPAFLRVDPRTMPGQGSECAAASARASKSSVELFPCPIKSGQGIYLDPYGFAFLCPLLRRPRYDLSRMTLARARGLAMVQAGRARFKSESRCRSCGLKVDCPWCPGFAYLETGNREEPVAYCCQIARGSAQADA